MVVSSQQAILKKLSKATNVSIVAGTYRGLSTDPGDYRVMVDFDGGRVPAHSTGVRPALNDPVWVMIVDGVAFMLGHTLPLPGKGTVVTASGGTSTVSTDIGTLTVTYTGTAPAVGAVVKLMWNDGGHILGTLTPPPAPEVPAAPGGGGGRRTVTFTALDSGSFESYWWTNDVYSSASNRGAWFYGSKIRDTIPSTASIVSASIYLPKPKRLLGSRPFGRHTHGSKPGGGISIVDDSTLSATSGWVPIPTTLVDDLKTAVGGLGFDIGGYNVWPGTQADGQSGSLRVTYDS